MTLNQLALAMWEKLNFQGMDASALSRIINGERLFTLKQLTTFGQILRLRKIEQERLKLILLQELKIRFGFEEDFLTKKPF
jgi:hypothetical protein